MTRILLEIDCALAQLLDDAVVRDSLPDHCAAMLGVKVEQVNAKVGHAAGGLQPLLIAASRIRPWLASGWGCRDRRLSTG